LQLSNFRQTIETGQRKTGLTGEDFDERQAVIKAKFSDFFGWSQPNVKGQSAKKGTVGETKVAGHTTATGMVMSSRNKQNLE